MLFNKNENKPASSIEEKIKLYRRQGHIVPPRKIIKNAEQIEGILCRDLKHNGIGGIVDDTLCIHTIGYFSSTWNW